VTDDDLPALLDLALGVGRDVAGELRRRRVGASSVTKTSVTDLVTEVDVWAEQTITAALLAARPDDGVLGEEGADHPTRSGITWVIDPIDGTTNFVYDHPGFSVSIAARRGDQGLVGVVLDPLLGETFWATAGGGAFCNGEPIRVSQASLLGSALVATGFGYDAERRAGQARVLTTVLPAVRDIRRMGGCAIDLCSVACGRVDAFYERGVRSWDVAAGELIVREAGGTVSDLAGGRDLDRIVVAAGPGIHVDLCALLVEARADED
jgi:myo-inositol-1(or 4)-monophosphatase